MGYQVLIQRIEEQHRQQNQIEPEDIETLVSNDPELSIDDNSFFSATNPITGELIKLKSNTIINWFGFGGEEDGFVEAKLIYANGKIVCDGPDDNILRKLFLISQLLKASLKGEEGEVYIQTVDGEIIGVE